MSDPIILFGEVHPDVYLIGQIYDPDVDGTDVASSGKIIPSVGSLVVDNGLGGTSYVLWVVHSVHPVTFKSTLVPARIVDDLGIDKVLSYGNDIYMIYYDKRVAPTRLVIDTKLVILGTNTSEYKLIKTFPDGTTQPISISVDADGSSINEFTVSNIGTEEDPQVQRVFQCIKPFATETCIALVWVNENKLQETDYTTVIDENNPGRVLVTLNPSVVYGVGSTVVIRLYSVSDRAPVIETAVQGVRRCSNCYTTFDMHDGELVYLELYDSAGVMTSRIKLIARHATVLNDFESSSNPITAFVAKANQEKDNGDFVLYTDQTVERLAIYPELIFADGSKQMLTVDGLTTFVYGLNEVQTTIAGMEYPILVKKFLAMGVPSLLGEMTPNGTRFLVLEKKLVIEPRGRAGISKISIIPIWNPTTLRWDVRYFAYYIERNAFLDVTNQVTYTNPDVTFNGQLLDTRQNIIIRVPETMPEGDVQDYEQVISLILRSNTATVPYEFSDVQPPAVPPFIPSETVYGIQDQWHNRPIINYDSTLEQYFIPTSLFPTDETDRAKNFLEPFYIHAEPPFIPAIETQAPTPTHFILRDSLTGRSLSMHAISVEDYDSPFALITLSSPNEYVSKTVIVEFLLQQGSTYSILYGVPVKVVTGTYNPQP